jgi:hypothetical protein
MSNNPFLNIFRIVKNVIGMDVITKKTFSWVGHWVKVPTYFTSFDLRHQKRLTSVLLGLL